MGRLLIKGGTIINEGARFRGYIEITGERISAIGRGDYPLPETGMKVVDATGKMVIPGVIDDQVHFREPGMTYKADIHSESIAAAAGGVTSYMEMPNTKPPATTIPLLEDKFSTARDTSVTNYSFYLGATNDNINEIEKADPARVCGLKVFMGSSTGNMLVDDPCGLEAIFSRSPLLIATHCEDEATVKAGMEYHKNKFGQGIGVCMHPYIRSAEACYRSSAKAVELAARCGTRLHVLHLSTARELSLFSRAKTEDKLITNEVCVHHLWFTDSDYPHKGNFIKWNPSIKSYEDREALRKGIHNGQVDVVATDHAPHTLDEKKEAYLKAPSGGPLVQHSLTAMMEMCRQGIFSEEQVVDKMCHAPAKLFKVRERGFLREGYFADIAVIDPDRPWTVSAENILSKCGWSPFEGDTFNTSVTHTVINGQVVYSEGRVDTSFRGKALEFGS